MDRRRFLLGAAGAAGTLAGCAGFPSGEAGRNREGTPAPADATAARFPESLPVPREAFEEGAPRDAIPAITDPAFASDWSDFSVEVRTEEFGVRTIRPRLLDSDRVVGVVRDGQARAYPLAVLNWHEAVNDAFGGPVLVTFCPLCGSGLVAERTVEGRTLTFGVSGLLWKDNLVLYDDATDSLWVQVAATAVRGPMTGTTLSVVPSTLTTWGAWRRDHPDTEVLLPPPESGTVVGRGSRAVRNYGFDPYAAYEGNDRVGVRDRAVEDDRLPPKTEVLGLTAGGTARAYPRPVVERRGVVNDTLGGVPVAVAVGPGGAMAAFDRRLDGNVRWFRAAGDGQVRAAGSRWAVPSGRAVSGPYRGERLARLEATPLFWFSWLDFHPDTSVYGGES